MLPQVIIKPKLYFKIIRYSVKHHVWGTSDLLWQNSRRLCRSLGFINMIKSLYLIGFFWEQMFMHGLNRSIGIHSLTCSNMYISPAQLIQNVPPSCIMCFMQAHWYLSDSCSPDEAVPNLWQGDKAVSTRCVNTDLWRGTSKQWQPVRQPARALEYWWRLCP